MRKNNLIVIAMVLLSFCLLKPAFAEAIVFKWGTKVEARIIEKTDEYIKIDLDGSNLVYRLEDIKSIEGENIGGLSKPIVSPIVSGVEKSPTQIFEDVSPSIVVITAEQPAGFSQGSGFIIRENGVVMTNFHVIAGAETIEVKLKTGKMYPVTGIIDYNPKRDVCVLKIDVYNLPVAPLGDSSRLKPGQKVLVIGAPLGLEYTVTDGLYSGARRELGQKSLQFSASISPGNSGGPLLNMQGEVVGITTYIKLGGQNLNFAVPINEAKDFIETYPKMSVAEFSTGVGKAHLFYDSAHQAIYLDNIDLAIDYFQKAIDADPNYVWAYSDLAAIYGMMGNADEEISLCKKAIAIDPNYQSAYINLGVAYGRKGMLNESIEELKKAIALDPKDAMAHDNLGVAYARKGMFDEAIAEHKKAVDINPYYGAAHDNLGFAYSEKGMYKEAIAAHKKAIAINSNDAQAHNNLAVAYYEAGQYDLAVKHCDKAIQLGFNVHPEFLKTLESYRKRVFLEKGPVKEAWHYSPEEHQRMKNLDLEIFRTFMLGNTAATKGEFNLAIKYIKKALSMVRAGTLEHTFILKNLINDYFNLGHQYFKKGLYDDAIDSFNKGRAVVGPRKDLYFKVKSTQFYYALVEVYAAKGDRAKAMEYIQKLRSLNTSRVKIRNVLGGEFEIESSKELADELERRILKY